MNINLILNSRRGQGYAQVKEPISNEKPFDYGLMGPQKSDVENKVQIQGGHRCLRVDLGLD